MDIAGQYFDCLCRTCMTELCEASSYDGKTKPQQQWQSLFDRINEESGALQIAELLTNAVPQIEVQLSDELPKKICLKCLQQLLSVHWFQQMCLQSDQQLRQQVSKKQNDPSIPVAAMEGEMGTHDSDSCTLGSFQSSTTHQNIENSSVQEPLETAEQEVKPEVTEANDADIDQLLEDCRDSQGNLSEFIKNEPIEDNDQQLQKQNDEPDMDDNDDGDTIQSIISGKDAVMAIECEPQQENDPFYYSHDLRRHMLQHTGEKPYKCKYCERSFSQSGHRIMHMRVHLGGVNTYRCEFCPSRFPAVKELRLHLTKHKNEDTETRERNMKALKEAEARLELKLSKKETPQPSLQQFEKKATENLKKHHLIHDEDRPYECPLCPRRFKSYQNMYQHKAIHEGIGREACDICGKSIIKRRLKEHKLTHSNEKAYECDFCGRRFAHIWYLRRHIPTHTGEKKYKCNYCERTFVRSQDQLKHTRVHLGLNIHRCVLCPLAFPAAKELRLHLTTHKNEDSETRERNMKGLHEADIKLQQTIFVEETQLSKEEENKK